MQNEKTNNQPQGKRYPVLSFQSWLGKATITEGEYYLQTVADGSGGLPSEGWIVFAKFLPVGNTTQNENQHSKETTPLPQNIKSKKEKKKLNEIIKRGWDFRLGNHPLSAPHSYRRNTAVTRLKSTAFRWRSCRAKRNETKTFAENTFLASPEWKTVSMGADFFYLGRCRRRYVRWKVQV